MGVLHGSLWTCNKKAAHKDNIYLIDKILIKKTLHISHESDKVTFMYEGKGNSMVLT